MAHEPTPEYRGDESCISTPHGLAALVGAGSDLVLVLQEGAEAN